MFTFPMTMFSSVESGMTDPLTEGDYTNLLCWWDFSDNSTVLDSGGSPVTGGADVYKVTDKKGSVDFDDYDSTSTLPSYDPGNGSYQANGKDGLIFSGDTLGTTNAPSYTNAAQFSAFSCFHLQSTPTSASPVALRVGTSNRGGWWLDPWGGFGAVQGTDPFSPGNYAHFGSPDTSAPHVYGNRNDWGASPGTTMWVWYDSATTVTDTQSSSWAYISNAYNKLVLGANLLASVSATVDMYCYELLVYDGVISDENTELVMNYLMKKYGV